MMLSLFVFIYGVIIIVYGIRTKRFIHLIGRIREISYVLIMFTPIVYGVIELNLYVLSTILVFSLPFYSLIEFINYKVPDPGTYKEGKEE